MQKLTEMEKQVFSLFNHGMGINGEQIAEKLGTGIAEIDQAFERASAKAKANNGAIESMEIAIPYGLTPETLSENTPETGTQMETPLQWFLEQLAQCENDQDRKAIESEMFRIFSYALALMHVNPNVTLADSLETGIIAERG